MFQVTSKEMAPTVRSWAAQSKAWLCNCTAGRGEND